jgi:hypothetical protein
VFERGEKLIGRVKIVFLEKTLDQL